MPRPFVSKAGALGLVLGSLVFVHQSLMMVGLNSKAHFNMASNFWVSPAYSNHYFFRAPHWEINEPIRVLGSSSRTLRRSDRGARALPWLYFSDLAARRPKARVKFIKGGKKIRTKVRKSPELFRKSQYAWWFPGRKIPTRELHPRCHHVAPQNR